MTSGGKTANRTGQQLERAVAGILDNAGYQKIARPMLFWAMREMDQPFYAQQVEVGRDIYGKTRRVDFMCYHPKRWPQCLAIQCKWQAVGGTVDEKFPFEVLSIQQNEYPTITVLDGGGYSRGAETWLKGQAGKNQLKHVYDLGEFQRFSARGSI